MQPHHRSDAPKFDSWAQVPSAASAAAAATLSPRTGRKHKRSCLVQDIEDAHSVFNPEELTLLQSKPYEQAFAKALLFKLGDSDTQQLNELEDTFKLTRHTLSKFVAWKKKQPVMLADIRTDADRKKAARQKQMREVLEAQEKAQDERDKLKWAAAAVIQKRYKDNLADMILDAARAAITGMHSSVEKTINQELKISAKAVCL
jgi:hypothetical protein